MNKEQKTQTDREPPALLISCLQFGALFLTMLSISARMLGPADIVDLGASLVINLFLFVAACLWVLHMLLTGKMQWISTRLNIAVGVFLLLAFISALRAPSWHRSIPMLIEWTSNIMLFYLVIQFAARRDTLRMLIHTIIACAVVLSLYSLVQYYHSLDVIARRLAESPEEVMEAMGQPMTELTAVAGRVLDKRVFATFTNPNSFAGFLLLTIPLSIGMLLDICRRRRSSSLGEASAMFMAVALQLYAFHLTFSKGGMLCLVISALLFAAFAFRAFIIKHRIFAGAAGVLLAIAVIGGVLFAGSDTTLGARIRGGGESFAVRVGYWGAGVKMIADYPLLGVGLDNFGARYSEYKLPAACETQRAHNTFIQVAADMGLPGLLAFCLLWGGLIWAVVPRGSTRLEDKADRPVFLTALSAGIFSVMLTASLFGTLDVTSKPGMRLLAYAMLGMAWVYSFIPRGMSARQKKSHSGILQTAADYTRLGLAVGLVGFLLHNIVDFDMHVPGCSQTAWLLAAVGICMQPAFAIKQITVKPLMQVAIAVAVTGCAAIMLLPEKGVVARVHRSEAARYEARAILRNDDSPESLMRAIALYDRAAETNPYDERVQYELANLHLSAWHISGLHDLQSFQLAIRHFNNTISLDPSHTAAWHLKSMAYRHAASQHRGVLVMNIPGSDINTIRLATDELEKEGLLSEHSTLNARQRDYLPSIWAAHQAVRLYPTSAKYHFHLADTYRMANIPDRMLVHYEKALEFDSAVSERRLKLEDSQRDAATRHMNSAGRDRSQ